jgi:hypothetical protein
MIFIPAAVCSLPCSMVKLSRGHRNPSPYVRKGWFPCPRGLHARRSQPPLQAVIVARKNPGFRDDVGRHLKSGEASALPPRFGLSDCVDPRERPTVGSGRSSPLPSLKPTGEGLRRCIRGLYSLRCFAARAARNFAHGFFRNHR